MSCLLLLTGVLTYETFGSCKMAEVNVLNVLLFGRYFGLYDEKKKL